jgi:hypothetical protein
MNVKDKKDPVFEVGQRANVVAIEQAYGLGTIVEIGTKGFYNVRLDDGGTAWFGYSELQSLETEVQS